MNAPNDLAMKNEDVLRFELEVFKHEHRDLDQAIEALVLASEGLEQQEAAVELEIEAKKLRDEKDTMQKQLDANTEAMAEMRAMMQKMMEKGD